MEKLEEIEIGPNDLGLMDSFATDCVSLDECFMGA